ncbi:STAS-like domain-containing protein [candidate division KSB1 bacterium]|nr:STAS-like domain-containing protein [candidate division KSB1 bacterium]
MELKIKNIIGIRCITRDDGQKIYAMIQPELLQKRSVKLDFKGVYQFASPFFNFAIGQLLKDFSIEELKRLLEIKNLLADGKLVVNRVIENASKYHQDVNYRQIVDSILEQQAAEVD